MSLATLLLWTSVAWADNVNNDVVVGGTDTFTAGGSTTINYWIVANSGDGQSGCNAQDETAASVTINTPSGVTATPASLAFTGCGTGAKQTVQLSSSTPGNYSITVSVSDSGTGTYNTQPAAFTLRVLAAVDNTPPAITPSITGTLGNNGWYTTDVTVTWSVLDNESSISSSNGCASTTISSDTTGTTLTCSATSAGGTSEESITLTRDATPPLVSVTGVSKDATYTLGSVPAAGCSTTDASSGVATAAALSTSGGPVGEVTATCSGAEDHAGNTASASVTHRVVYDWTGFFRPIDNLPVINQVKAGSAVPVKFSLSGYQGLSIMAAGFPKSAPVSCDPDAQVDGVETTVTAGSSSLNYDSSADQYTYVWKTDRSWNGCRQLTVQLIDGSTYKATFKLTK